MNLLNDNVFENFAKELFKNLKSDETLSLNYSAEETHFTRLTDGKIRQVTNLVQGFNTFKYIKGSKTLGFTLPYVGDSSDLRKAVNELEEKRKWIDLIPEDPFLVKPENKGSSKNEKDSNLKNNEEMLIEILNNSKDVDLAGVFSVGTQVRASINSLGQYHWFKTKNFCLDYSLYNKKQKAVKSLYAGRNWNSEELKKNIEDAKAQLVLLDIPSKAIERGEYRVYLAPSAVAELLGTLNWGGLSMGAHKHGQGSLEDLWKGKLSMSSKFTLSEDFSLGLEPQFNQNGEVASDRLPLIENGVWKNFLVNSRTANEFKIESNNAGDYEGMRSPKINTGDLKKEDILARLGTGIYLSDLHYINYSDRTSARVTGMTRYACFWVENGKIVAPINDLRFDESFYNIFGDKLEAVTDFSSIIPATGTYEQRDTGGVEVPGLLLSGFKFTL